MKFLKAFFKHPVLIIVICVLATCACGFFIKDLALENSLRSFFPQKDASYKRLTDTEETFGSMLAIGITLETKNGSDILTPEYIDVVRKITDRTLELPEVEDVDSITHIDYVCDHDGTISASKLIPEEYAGSEDDIAQLRERLTEWHEMYNRVIVNDNLTGFQMQISLRAKNYETEDLEKAESRLLAAKAALKNAEDKNAALNELKEAKAEYKAKKSIVKKLGSDIARQQVVLKQIRKIAEEEVGERSLILKLVGEPVLSESSKNYMISDLVRLIPLVVLVVLISLYFSFKTVTGTVLPLVTVLMSTIISVGLMGLFDVTFTLVSSVIPVALIAVGSAYGIHVLTHYYIEVKSVEDMTREKFVECIFRGLNEVKLAVFLAGLTTAVGFISLITSPLGPLHSFAVFTAIGVGVSLLLSVTFIPAVLLLRNYNHVLSRLDRMEKMSAKVSARVKAKFDNAKRKLELARILRGGKSEDEASGETLYNIYKFFCGSIPRLVVTSACVIVLSIMGIRYLKIDTALINYFDRNCDFRKDVDYVDKQYAGTNSVFFNITGPEKGDITNPELLVAVDEMEEYLKFHNPNIGKIVSFTAFIKKINQVWHVPGKRDVVNSGSGADESLAGLDDWGDFGDESSDGSLADLDDWSDFGDETAADTSSQANVPLEFHDPNEQYVEILARPQTTKDVLDLINKAYIKAGGKYATPDKIVDELMKEVNYNGKAYYEIPYDVRKYPVASREELKRVVDNYLVLLSGSLERFIDDDLSPKTMRITCQLRSHNSEESGKIIKLAKNFAEEHFPEGYTLEATGSAEMEYTMTEMIMKSQIASLGLSLFSVFLIIAVSFKSCWAGLLGTVPLLFTILLNYMMMGFCGINLDFITSIIASVAVGVGIDYTIHFLTTYKEERSKSDDIVLVTKETFKKSGHGIITNALAVGLGFLVLILSEFVVLRCIGILVAIVMFTSSFLAMTIIPGILNFSDPKFIRPEEENK